MICGWGGTIPAAVGPFGAAARVGNITGNRRNCLIYKVYRAVFFKFETCLKETALYLYRTFYKLRI